MSDLYDFSSLNWKWLNGLDSGEPLNISPRLGPRFEWAGQLIKSLKVRSRFQLHGKGPFIDVIDLFAYKSSYPDIYCIVLSLTSVSVLGSSIHGLINARFISPDHFLNRRLVYLDTRILFRSETALHQSSTRKPRYSTTSIISLEDSSKAHRQ